MQEGDLMTRAELAGYLGVPRSTLASWAYTGTGPRYFKIGKHARYRLADVLAWLEANAREPRSIGAA